MTGARRVVCWLAVAVPLAAQAGEVQQLLRSDPSLAARERALQTAWRAAQAQARGTPLAAPLQQAQRDWRTGRDDCWKATTRTWITARWTVDSVAACIDAQTRLRTAELQASWRLLPVQTTRYTCGGGPADEVVAHHTASDPPVLRIERGDRAALLWQVPMAGEGAYDGRNIAASRTADGLLIEWLDATSGRTETLRCSAAR